MDKFERLLKENTGAVERFIKLRVASGDDAEDILQEVLIAAFQKFGTLKNEDAFKAWIISIARNKCTEWYRRQKRYAERSIDEVPENELVYNRMGRTDMYLVDEAMEQLSDKDREILTLFYWEELSQAEIAEKLSIPTGTVKSRLYSARERFKQLYPYHHRKSEGADNMKKIPERMPEYKIARSEKETFAVKWEELWGLFIIPREGEKLVWSSYERDGVLSEWGELNVSGKAEIHGVECMEVNELRHEKGNDVSREFNYYAQLTDTHARMLAERYMKNGVRKMLTFLDGDDFALEWGYGEENCGRETNIAAKGEIIRVGNNVSAKNTDQSFDIVGRYDVTIGGRIYDTVCVISLDSYCGNYIATEQYIDKNGRTVLWRRFNRSDWAVERFEKPWTELLPDNERITINGETYVHWYDCITNYIL